MQDWFYARNKRFRKIMTLAVCGIFLFSNFTFAEPGISTRHAESKLDKPAKQARQAELIANLELQIPQDYGIIKEFYKGKDSPLIIHIQDLHCNFQAQSSIAKILQSLIEDYDLSLVGVEGSAGKIDTSRFASFPDKKIKEEVATYFMKQGRITGPEFLSITGDLPFTIYGAEERQYYIENMSAFQRSLEHKDAISGYINEIKAILIKLKERLYTKQLKELDLKIDEFENKHLSLSDFTNYLRQLAQKKKIDISGYPNFVILAQAVDLKENINFPRVDEQRTKIIETLTGKLSKEALSEFLVKSLSFRITKITAGEYYNYLKDIASSAGVDLSKYKDLSLYIDYVALLDKIDDEKLFEEREKIENLLKEKLYTNKEQKQLDKLLKNLKRISNLYDIRATNKDIEYYNNNKEEFKIEIFTKFIDAKSKKLKLSYYIDPKARLIEENLPIMEDFYVVAVKRDNALVDNAIDQMKRTRQKVAVLVTGGFHTKGITDILKEKGLSYIVITPRVANADLENTTYMSILKGERTPFEQLLVSGPEEANKFAPQSQIASPVVRKIKDPNTGEEYEPLRQLEIDWGYRTLAVAVRQLKERGLSNNEIKTQLSHDSEIVKSLRRNIDFKAECIGTTTVEHVDYFAIKIKDDKGNEQKFVIGYSNKLKVVGQIIEEFSGGAEVDWSEWKYGDDIDTLISTEVPAQTAIRGPDGKFGVFAGGLPGGGPITLKDVQQVGQYGLLTVELSDGTIIEGTSAHNFIVAWNKKVHIGTLQARRPDVREPANGAVFYVGNKRVSAFYMGDYVHQIEAAITIALKEAWEELAKQAGGLPGGEGEKSLRFKVGNTQIEILKGDITKVPADAVIAPVSPTGIGIGVTGAIIQSIFEAEGFDGDERAAAELAFFAPKESIQAGNIWFSPLGRIKTTAGWKYVVSAFYDLGKEREPSGESIKDVTKNALKGANGLHLEKVAFPAFGTGLGLDPLTSADWMLSATNEFLSEYNPKYLKTIKFVLYDSDTFEAFQEVAGRVLVPKIAGGLPRGETPAKGVGVVHRVEELAEGGVPISTINGAIEDAFKDGRAEPFDNAFLKQLIGIIERTDLSSALSQTEIQLLIDKLKEVSKVQNVYLITPRNRSPGIVINGLGSYCFGHFGVHRNQIYLGNGIIDKLIKEAQRLKAEGKLKESEAKLAQAAALLAHDAYELARMVEARPRTAEERDALLEQIHKKAEEIERVICGQSVTGKGSALDDRINEVVVSYIQQVHDNLTSRINSVQTTEEYEALKREIAESPVESYLVSGRLFDALRQTYERAPQAQKTQLTNIARLLINRLYEHKFVIPSPPPYPALVTLPPPVGLVTSFKGFVAAIFPQQQAQIFSRLPMLASTKLPTEEELIRETTEATPEALRQPPIPDMQYNPQARNWELPEGPFTFRITREDVERLKLREWLANYEREAQVSTAGIRGRENIVFPWDTTSPINMYGIMLATMGKALYAREAYGPVAELHKLAGSEVRYNSILFTELIARVQAAQGIITHIAPNYQTYTIWMASFLTYKLGLLGGEYVTSSHAISTMNATKDLNTEGSQYLPSESMQFVNKIRWILQQIEEKGFYEISIAARNDRHIDTTLMERIEMGIPLYVEYLRAGVATAQNLKRIRQMQGEVIIEIAGGSMYKPMSQIFQRLGIAEKFRWFNIEETPYFHGVGKVHVNPKTGQDRYSDLTADTSIMDIDNEGFVHLPVIETMGYVEKLKGKPVGTTILLTDMDGDRIITAQIESITRIPELKKLGIAYMPLDYERVLAVYAPNQSFLLTMAYQKQGLVEAGEWNKYNWFIIKTTPSALSWEEWAEANNIPVVNVPVGFKEIAAVMRKVEAQMREHPGEEVKVVDVFGNEINLGRNPRLLFAGEESGGKIFGPTQLIGSQIERQAIAMREKSAGEAMVIQAALIGYLEGEGKMLSQYLGEIFEGSNIKARFDVRSDIKYFDENQPNPEILAGQIQEGLETRTQNDIFFLGLALGLQEGRIEGGIEAVREFLERTTFPGLSFQELEAIEFVGDGTYLRFKWGYLEVRPSGTEAKNKAYGAGPEKQALVPYTEALGNYSGERTEEYYALGIPREWFELNPETGFYRVKDITFELYEQYYRKGLPPISYTPHRPSDWRPPTAPVVPPTPAVVPPIPGIPPAAPAAPIMPATTAETHLTEQVLVKLKQALFEIQKTGMATPLLRLNIVYGELPETAQPMRNALEQLRLRLEAGGELETILQGITEGLSAEEQVLLALIVQPGQGAETPQVPTTPAIREVGVEVLKEEIRSINVTGSELIGIAIPNLVRPRVIRIDVDFLPEETINRNIELLALSILNLSRRSDKLYFEVFSSSGNTELVNRVREQTIEIQTAAGRRTETLASLVENLGVIPEGIKPTDVINIVNVNYAQNITAGRVLAVQSAQPGQLHNVEAILYLAVGLVSLTPGDIGSTTGIYPLVQSLFSKLLGRLVSDDEMKDLLSEDYRKAIAKAIQLALPPVGIFDIEQIQDILDTMKSVLIAV